MTEEIEPHDPIDAIRPDTFVCIEGPEHEPVYGYVLHTDSGEGRVTRVVLDDRGPGDTWGGGRTWGYFPVEGDRVWYTS